MAMNGRLEAAPPRLPQQVQERIESLPKLTREQCGHLRHFWNLATTIDGDWGAMGSQEPGQEWDTAYRYQISHMAYAAGAAHYHHQPLMRSMFKELFERLIAKMLRREVWGYWYMTSQSGIVLNPDLKELRKPMIDPVGKENIMYSGHLLLMVSLYTMLFHDYRYDEPGSIQFDWNPLFFGMGRETFDYDRHSLQQAILDEMEREGWIGVCCEPNLVFVVCNQFPLLSIRYNDITDNKHVIDEVLPKYRAAWVKKGGLVAENGLFRRFYAVQQDAVPNSTELGHTAWAMSFMPWNFEQVQSMYPSAGRGFIQRLPDRTNIHPPDLAATINKIVDSEGGDENDPALVERAKVEAALSPPSARLYPSPAFGHVANWFSEVAGPLELQPLLAHADQFLNPTWKDGGFYYSRCDSRWDESGNYVHMDPYTGNAAIGYSRLNVLNGQKKMWDRPWTKTDLDSRPWVDGLSFGDGVDCARAYWDGEQGFMALSLRAWAPGSNVKVQFGMRNLPSGSYAVYQNGMLQKEDQAPAIDEQLSIEAKVGAEGTDIVVLRMRD